MEKFDTLTEEEAADYEKRAANGEGVRFLDLLPAVPDGECDNVYFERSPNPVRVEKL